MIIKALVAARSGSVRVKNKNMRPFAGSTLLELKLRQLKLIPNLDGIILNSNDDEMLALAESLGCETVRRDPYYASNTVSMSDVYRNMAENCDCDVIAYINCTNPLIKDQTIIDAIECYKEIVRGGTAYNSLNSAHLVKEFLFLDNKPVNYDLQHQPRSQDLPDYYALNFAISIISRELMIEGKNVVGSKPYIYGIDEVEATDIDNPIDFEFAEYVYTHRND
ncbi:MAG: acylneuraminate cytidylyltransferase family protein [Oscillospiraceae bacterium]|nr:acylneuraminate cytidylyltransferase family protein [Oscillospiraceae bacterium]